MFKVTGNNTTATALACAVRILRMVNVYTAGGLWRMRLNYVGNVLWLNVVFKWSVRPPARAVLVYWIAGRSDKQRARYSNVSCRAYVQGST